MKTNETVKNVAQFLNLSWTNEFLHHEKYVGNKIAVSNTEWSTDQMYVSAFFLILLYTVLYIL
jgi:hypothetical protein